MNAADMEDSRQVLRVELGARGYEIHIGAGLIAAADDLLADCLGTGTVFIVTDDIVASHYLTPLQDALGRLGRHAHPLILPAGEATKSFTQWQELCESMLAIGAERGSTIIALGGGVIGDLAGFAAATLLRGVDFVQIPTTLLAQVDSSVGGKTAINTGHGKNLVGAFYQPKRVLIDTAALDSLPPRELRAGYAETVKYGLIGDAGFFEWLERHGQDLLAGDPAARRYAIAVSCAAKAATVRADEREKGQRALLN
ncbi:MAG: 3-dehydroquinate synthase family protein, partial [Pseudomonadota bacterium]|nr:3-dehydroquinate synthase family protein [Pseudomonadota bacterium]